jgi:myo-inositol-1(or 4)-monophosphatase
MCCDGNVTDSRSDPAELRTVAEQLAAQAAAYVRSRRDEVFGGRGAPGDALRAKSTPTDPVTIVDTETERLLRDRLAQLRPGEPVVGEEGGGRAATDGGSVSWVLDPVDGTVNFVYGLAAYAVSVAAQVDGASVAGAVADVVGGRLYSAGLRLGAHVVDASGRRRPLRCNDIDDVSMALVGTGFGYAPERRRRQAAVLAELLPAVRDVRRIGSAALDLCWVAEGKLDAHYEHGLSAWDWAAAALIAAEAGAWVRLPSPRATADSTGLVLAAAPGIAPELLELLERIGAADTLPD